jgi:predicted nucleotidyltransferase
VRPLTSAALNREDAAAVSRFLASVQAAFGDRLRRVVLYGSKARGDDHTESDVDLLVLVAGNEVPWAERRRVSEIAADVAVDSGVDLSAKLLAEREFDRALAGEQPFAERVEQEGIVLWPAA